MNKKLIAVLAVSTILVAGCSSSKRTSVVTQDSLSHQQLQQAIKEVQTVAKSALQTAQQAKLTAQDAKAMSIRTDEKLNRVFKKAQMK